MGKATSIPRVPNDYFDEKFLLTAGGTTTAVWLFCAVVSNLIPGFKDENWKYIAFVISMAMTFIFAAKTGQTKVRTYTLIILNGMVIYAGATGLNGISRSANFFGTTKVTSGNADKVIRGSLFPFIKEP